MTSRQQSRREILKAGAVLTATASFPASIRFAAAQSKAGAAHPNAQIDAVLRRAADAKDVPGVVAVAATDKGILYEGAFSAVAILEQNTRTPTSCKEQKMNCSGFR